MIQLLFTGASGFLGNNILCSLRNEYEVTTLGHLPADDLTVNLAKNIPEFKSHYDIVLHAAGKAHVIPKTPDEEKLFYDINFEGTKNLCFGLEKVGVPKALVFISTVAVYGCESGILISEDHPRNGTTPYAKSKIMAEDFLTEWCKKHKVILTILRPSLLAGKNPPGNLGDMIRGIEKGFYVNVAGGRVQKSILMADDIARLVTLACNKGGIYNVCDSDQPSFGEISKIIAKQLGKRAPLSIPLSIAKLLAKCGDLLGKNAPINTLRLKKITSSLTFSNANAVKELNWQPLKVLENFQIK